MTEALDHHLRTVGGATTSADMLTSGVPRRAIGTALRRGTLERVRQNAYIAPPSDDAFGSERHRRSAIAVARASRNRLALTHESAALLLGLPCPTPSAVHACWLGTGTKRRRDGLSIHGVIDPRLVQPLAPPYGDVLVSVPELAALQVACRKGGAHGLAAADAALRDLGIDRARFELALTAIGPCRCPAATRAVIGLASPLSESPGESRCRWLFDQLGFTQPRQQVRLADAAGFVGRVDFLFEEEMVVVEFDGRIKYTGDGGPQAVFEEKVREDRLRRLGYTVVRLVWADLRDPGRVRALLMSAGVLPRPLAPPE